ncbi:MAG TPA: XRE family transcriptional regulator [Pseudonocardiaceae bacterium]
MTSQSRRSEALELASRLRSLRLHHWAEVVKQPDLGRALGVGISSVSSWESADAPKVPPESRLRGYATFFASPRSLDSRPPRLLRDDELTDEERGERDKLFAELSNLRAAAVGEFDPSAANIPPSLWHFPDGGPVRIVCAALPEADRPPYASPANHNFMALAGYGDLDALAEVFGHIRAENRESDVQFRLADRFLADDLKAHLVFLGNMARTQGDRFLRDSKFPVRQVQDDRLDGEIFEIVGSDPPRRFGPQLAGDDPPGALVEDVGFLLRTVNPHFITRTLTICSGVFTRGVYGAVRCLTDRGLRDENSAYLSDRFGDAPTFGLLMRVRVADHTVPTPDLREEENRLYEYPPRI